MAAQLDALLGAHGVPTAFDRAACDAAGALGLFFHDKAQGVALVRDADGGALPPHAETAILTPSEFLRLTSWAELAACYRARSGDAGEPDALYVKSSRDSGGNVAARLSAAEFERRFAALRARSSAARSARRAIWPSGSRACAPTWRSRPRCAACRSTIARWPSSRAARPRGGPG